jgi:DNA repair exonuclease SbcCD ATPase subunit
MAKKYTLSESASFLGVQQSEIEDLVASGDITFEIVNDEYRIPEELLLRIRMDNRRKRIPGVPPSQSAIDDIAFVGYIDDLISIKTNEINQKVEENTKKSRADLENLKKALLKKIETIGENISSLTDMELTQKGQDAVESLMRNVMNKLVEDEDLGIGKSNKGEITRDNIKMITDSIEEVLDRKLTAQNTILDSLKRVEEKLGDNENKLFSAIESLKTGGVQADVDSLRETINETIKETIDKHITSLTTEQAEIKKIVKSMKNTRGELTSGDDNDLAKILRALEDLDTGQNKAKKMLYDLNVNFQKTISNKIGELKQNFSLVPEAIKEIQELIPAFRETVDKKLSRIDRISETLELIRDNFTIEGQGNMLAKLDEVKKAIENSDIGDLIPHIDNNFKETINTLEKVIRDLNSSQQKKINEHFSSERNVPPEVLELIKTQVEEVEMYFRKLSVTLEDRFNAVSRTLKKTNTLDNTEIVNVLEARLEQIVEFVGQMKDKFDLQTISGIFENTLTSSLEQLKESQDSFQKIMVNLNINNQKSIVEKLEHLDRLNELVRMRDDVDEISEQMATFEAIMSDINQLVDERLNILNKVNENLSRTGNESLTGYSSEELASQMHQVRSIIDALESRFSVDAVIRQVRDVVDDRTKDLREHQESIQKILVNMQVNTQKHNIEKWDEISNDIKDIKGVKEQFQLIETLIPNISELIELKLEKLADYRIHTDKISGEIDMSDSLTRFQRIVENEAKSIRHAMDASQKIIMNMGMSNHKILVEKLNSTGLSGKSLEEIAEKNQEVLENLMGFMDPGVSLYSSLKNINLLLETIRENVSTENLLERIFQFTNYQASELGKSQDETIQILTEISGQLKNEIVEKIDRIQGAIAEVSVSVDAENIISSVGDVIIEGNEILKENQVTILNHQLKSHQELLEAIGSISTLRGQLSTASSAGDLLPVLEQLLENQITNFKKDLDGAHKILINHNINLQKQLLGKIKDVITIQASPVDTDQIVSAIDYMLEAKLGDLKENQEALLSVNLNTQKALKDKLEDISSIHNNDAPSAELKPFVSMIERIISEKIMELKLSYEEAQKAMEQFSHREQEEIINKLDNIADNVRFPMDMEEIGKFIPTMRETLEETYGFLDDFKNNIEIIKKNIKLHNPEFFNEQFDELRKFMELSSMPDELAKSMEVIIETNLERHRETLKLISERVNYIYEVMENMGKEPEGVEFDKIRRLFSVKIEETRQLEKQLVETIKHMQSSVYKDFAGESAGVQDHGNLRVILKELEETRRDQENLLSKVDNLSELISRSSVSKIGEVKIPPTFEKELEQLRRDNSNLSTSLENLKRENSGLQKQLKSSRSLSEKDSDVNNVMAEKNRLLDECYREKSELREILDREKRDKYEIIQKYETEKKELIDSLALERMQRDREKAELELLRAEAKKKKWW